MIFEKYFFCGYTLKKPLAGNCVQTDVKTGNLISFGEFGTNKDPEVVKAKLSSQMEDAGIDLHGADPREKIGQRVVGSDGTLYKVTAEGMLAERKLDGFGDRDPNQMVSVNAYADSLKQDILDTWKDSTKTIVNAQLAELREVDPEGAKEIETMLAKVREKEYILPEREMYKMIAEDSKAYDKEQALIYEKEKLQLNREIFAGWVSEPLMAGFYEELIMNDEHKASDEIREQFYKTVKEGTPASGNLIITNKDTYDYIINKTAEIRMNAIISAPLSPVNTIGQFYPPEKYIRLDGFHIHEEPKIVSEHPFEAKVPYDIDRVAPLNIFKYLIHRKIDEHE